MFGRISIGHLWLMLVKVALLPSALHLIYILNDAAKITVIEGIVSVDVAGQRLDKDGRKIHVNQQVDIDNQGLGKTKMVDQFHVLAWRDKKLIFDDVLR